MRIGILSDTHDQVLRTRRAVRLLADAGAELLVHCGDFTRPEVVEELAGMPVYGVVGNNDEDEAGLTRAFRMIGGTLLGRGGVFECAGKRLAVTHGDMAREWRRLTGLAPDYLFFGHSHAFEDAREGPTRLVNPGALYRAATWSVALLDLDTDELTRLTLNEGG